MINNRISPVHFSNRNPNYPPRSLTQERNLQSQTNDNYSNVVYVGSTPYCKKNMKYIKKQSLKFLEGKSPPDFAAEDYEVNYKNRATIDDLTDLGKEQLALD